MKKQPIYTLLSILFFVLALTNAFSQQRTALYLVEFNSALSTKTNLPFWMVSNQYGKVPNNNYGAMYASVFSDFKHQESSLNFSYKASFTGLKEAKNNFFVNELYLSTRYKKIQLDFGIKNPDEAFEGLSSSNGNISRSTNARSFPGYNLQLIDYVSLPFAQSWLRVKGNYSDYVMNDKRVVSNVRLHAKSILLKSKLSPKLDVITGMYHYAQWGGTSPEYGKQPSSFKDYIKVVTGSAGGSEAAEGDQLNVLGNQLGAYLLQFNYNTPKNNWSFYYSHPFEDTSGLEMQNWRDGLYGVFIDLKKPTALITHLLSEFTYTKHMSGANPPDDADGGRGRDNYFNNGIFSSGWTYFGNTIGSPYFPTKETINNITPGIKVGYNRFRAFNFGMKGLVHTVKYKLLLSHVTYFGWFDSEFQPKPQQFSAYLAFQLPKIPKLPFEISVGTAFDTGTFNPVNFGGFLTISKRGNF